MVKFTDKKELSVVNESELTARNIQGMAVIYDMGQLLSTAGDRL